MKKIIAVLLFLQLTVIGLIISMAVNVNHFDQLMFAEATDIDIVFIDEPVGLEHLMNIIEEHDLLMTKSLFMSFEEMVVYATDVSFEGYLSLREGRWPEVGAQEFISNIVQDDVQQVGLIRNLTPEFDIMIRPMADQPTSQINGQYRIHTIDTDLLLDIADEMSSHTHLFHVYHPMLDDRGFFETLTMGIFVMPTVLTTILVAATPIVAFLCIVVALLQFSMSKAKESFTLHVHGFSQRKIIFKSLKDLLKTMLLAGGVAYVALCGYLFIAGLSMFYAQFTLFFLLTFGVIILIYLITCMCSMYLIFQLFSSHIAIKGYKPDFIIQVLNHALKGVFICLFLIGSHFMIEHLTFLVTGRGHLQNWEIARHVHRLQIAPFWPPGFEELEQQIHDLEALRLELTASQQGFLMNAQHILIHDLFPEFQWENRGEHLPPFELAPNGNRVDISLGYLAHNPITTVDGSSIEELLIWDDLVVNLLVPVQFKPDESQIRDLYLQDFYIGSLHWLNRDDYVNQTNYQQYTAEDLSVNIIYVEEGQYYFTFDTRVRPHDGNLIKDPIAVVHTDNFHPSFIMSLMGSSFYFISDSDNPFGDVADTIAAYGLDHSVRFATPTFTENTQRMRLIEQDIISAMVMLIALMLTNFIVNYNLVSNYFWRNKHTLFTKSLFGFGLLKRHRWFILSLLSYIIPIYIIMTIMLGWTVFAMGMIFLILDGILAFGFEKRLMQKSFSEVIKGER